MSAFTVSYTSQRCLPSAMASRKEAAARKKPQPPAGPASPLSIDLSSTRHRRLALYLLLHEARCYQRSVGLTETRLTEYMLRRCRPTPPPPVLAHGPAFRRMIRDVLELQQPRCPAFPDGNYTQCKVDLAQRNIWANPSC